MKDFFKFKIVLFFLFVFQTGFLPAQDFTGKSEAEIAQLFLTTTNAGKNKTEAKTFNKNVLKHFKSITPPNVSIALDVKMADVFKELYKKNNSAAYQFIMTMDYSYSFVRMSPLLTAEQRKFLKEESRKFIADYQVNGNTANSGSKSSSNPDDFLYGGKGSFPQQFGKSDYTINFPYATIYSNYSPLYLPRMKYGTSEVDHSFVKDLDYKYVKFTNATYASVRFTPNIPSYHLQQQISERTTMVIMMVAMNHLFPSATYLEAKNKGGFYTITSNVKPLGFTSGYNV